MSRVELMRIYREKWRKRNKDKVNARRRELRRLKRSKVLEGKYCMLCQIRMSTHSYRTQIYCIDCNKRNYKQVREDTRRRYLNKVV